MKNFDEIYQIAADNYGVITAAQARDAGVSRTELNRWCVNGWLARRGWGVYRLTRWVPTPFDAYAEAVALVGEGACLYGESVLALCNLALVDPSSITVATSRRVRREVPPWVRVVSAPKNMRCTFIEGVPVQPVADALRACSKSIMRERLIDAVEQARAGGFLTAQEYEELRREFT